MSIEEGLRLRCYGDRWRLYTLRWLWLVTARAFLCSVALPIRLRRRRNLGGVRRRGFRSHALGLAGLNETAFDASLNAALDKRIFA
jgi:hypothetical protein